MSAFLSWIGLPRREVIAWTLYDWANSAFATTVMSVLLPIYFADVAAAELPQNIRTAYWAYLSAVSLFVVALASPFLGALADILPNKKRYLGICLVFGSLSCVGLFWVERGDWLLAAVLYTIGSIGWALGNVFYESLLPHIAFDNEIDRVSTAGYAVGYLGGGLLLALNLAWILKPEWFFIPDKSYAVRLSFVSVGIWWVLFSIPLFVEVNEPPTKELGGGKVPSSKAIKEAGLQLMQTIMDLKNYRFVLLFLMAFWLYSDGLWTIMKMATIYGREIGIEQTQLIGAMLMVQFLGMPFTFAFGPIASWIGSKAGIILCLLVYIGVCVLGYFMTSAFEFWALAVAVALVQGGCQALSRSVYAQIIPKNRSAEFFGFFSISSKFAGIAGPLLFGFFAEFWGESRMSILALIVFFVVGILILLPFNVDRAKMAARALKS